MIRKFHEAKVNNHSSVTLWGTGSPKREFLYVDDLARAVLFALENILDEHLYNVGSGSDLSIKQLAKIIQNIVGHQVKIFWDEEKPDGTPRKIMNSKKLTSKGWKANLTLRDGIIKTYSFYRRQYNSML